MSLALQPETEARLLAAARARGKTPDEVVASLLAVLPAELGEGELLQEIHQGFSEDFWSRYKALIALRQAETLSAGEHKELIELSDQVEERTARRAQALAELAGRRGVTLDALVQHMGLRPVPVNP